MQGRVSQEDAEFMLNLAGLWGNFYIATKEAVPHIEFSEIYRQFKHVYVAPVMDDMQANSPTIDGKIVQCYFFAAIMISKTHSYEQLFDEIYKMADF